MRLVDFNEDTTNNTIPREGLPNSEDEFLKKPHVLSILDNEMEKIMQQTNIPDYDKWILYNEVLRRYLFFARQPELQNNYENKFSEEVSNIYPVLNNITEESTPKYGDKPNRFHDEDEISDISSINDLQNSLRLKTTIKNKNKISHKRIFKTRRSPVVTRSKSNKTKSRKLIHFDLKDIAGNWEELDKGYLEENNNDE